MTSDSYNFYSIVIYLVSAVIALIMLGVAISQLRRLTLQVEQAVKSNSISQLNALLSLEQQIAERRTILSEVGISISEAKNNIDSDFKALQLRFDEAKQMYLNGLDRLCFCIEKGLFNPEDMRIEYREIINYAVRDFADDFKLGTPYRNIEKVYKKWADQ